MHPRNLYRQRQPDFQLLASKYEDFRKFCKIDLNGKVLKPFYLSFHQMFFKVHQFQTSFDFKSSEAVRIFSMTLLKEDFGLDVEIPVGCLVPRLPVRLNYILWLEDLLLANNYLGHSDPSEVVGLDIGEEIF